MKGSSNKTIFVTGSAGFIGSQLVLSILKHDPSARVIGLDNFNSYYDVALKEARNSRINDSRYTLIRGDLTDKSLLNTVFDRYHPAVVINLAAQAGVRYSIDHPDSYIESNIIGFFNVLEMCRKYPVSHLVFASSSSVYGDSTVFPFAEDTNTDKPVSLYAATKKSGEVIAYSYSKLYKIPCTGLRFFTVYGPFGRPDMAYFKFAEKLVNGEPIELFNYGNCKRDFTYIDDIVDGIMRVMANPPEGEVPFDIFNIGKGRPDDLKDFVAILIEELRNQNLLSGDASGQIKYLPMQKGDVVETYADTQKLYVKTGYKPNTDLRTGIKAFCEWYSSYRKD